VKDDSQLICKYCQREWESYDVPLPLLNSYFM
jgi:hypothetical protein